MKRLPVALVLLVLVAAGCGRGGGEEESPQTPETVPVETLVVEPRDVTATVSATGTLMAKEDVPISAEASGRVDDVPVKVGDSVSSGEVLVRLDDELARLALRQAEAQLLAAEADLGDAETSLERATALFENGDISEAEFDAAQLRYTATKGAFLAAQAGYGSAERQLRNTAIESPIDGTVAFMYAEVGHLISLGSPVAHVVNDRTLEVEIGLTESQVVDVRAGRRATVSVRSLGGREFGGVVDYVGPRADDRTKTFPARIVLENRDGSIRPGMVGEVTIATQQFRDAIVIDRDWVVERYGEPAVFVVVDGAAQLRKVSLGRGIGDEVIVADGLAPGDVIVTLGHDQLGDGTLVSVPGAAAPADSTVGATEADERTGQAEQAEGHS